MRTRKIYWRDAAYEYIKIHGPMTAAQLLEVVVQKNGRPFSYKGPTNVNGATQLLRVDKRFTGQKTVWKTEHLDSPNTYSVLIWSVV